MNKPMSLPDDQYRELNQQLRRMTRRGFAWGGAAILSGFAAWKWLGSRSEEEMLRWPLRRALELDEKLARATFNPARKSREFLPRSARMPRVNGRYGIDPNLERKSWRLQIAGSSGALAWTLDQVKALPRFEITTELRCIEGWSEIVTWGGARLVDLASATGLALRTGQVGDPMTHTADLLPYVSLTTPNAGYYVGLDIASALHSQTLLCYEMNGEPLTILHGAPLRLAIPVKYGIKNLKQIGTIVFTDSRPADYWTSKGYDWYAGF